MAQNINTLPKWAQHRIAKLEADLAASEQKIASMIDGPDQSPVILDPFLRNLPLPNEPIRFILKGAYIDVGLDDRGTLRMHGQHGISVFPEAANVVRIATLTPMESHGG